MALLRAALPLVTLGVVACGAATPAARWDSKERAQIEGTFPKCEFFEDEGTHVAGYACGMGTFRAHDLPGGEDHARASRRLAEEQGKRSFTAPLEEVSARAPLTIGPETFDASIATYRPAPGTILTPEVFLVITPQAGDKKQAFSCSVSLMTGLDDKASIGERIQACMQGLKLLVEASR
jgi:hypothetical protein